MLNLKRLLVLLVFFTFGSQVQASLINGDFSSGFSSWQGEVTDIFYTTDSDIDPLPSSYVNNFDVSSGAAVLTTSTLIDDIFSVFLYQSFVVDTVAANEQLILSYDISASLSDVGFGDTAFAQLNYGTSFLQTIDLLSTSSVDISFLSGQTVELLFGVEDFDDVDDQLVVDNIAVSVNPVSVPGVLLLLLAGMSGLVVANKKRS